jgi:hypothetical protein
VTPSRPTVSTPVFSRRAVLLGGAGTLGLVALGGLSACSSGGDEDSSDTTAGEATRNLLSIFPAQGGFLIPTGEQRITYALADFEGAPIEGPENLTFRLVPPDGDPVEVEAQRHNEGIPTAYYPVRFTPEVEGVWTTLVDLDGQEIEASFAVSPASEVSTLARGEPFPRLETPTVDDARGVDPICTEDPPCPLHDITVAQALDEGTPLALLVATPAFCSTQLCGPVLDVLLSAQEQLPDARYLHAEVYADPQAVANIAEATRAPATETLGLFYEPSLFLVDGDGILVDRLDNIYDTGEAKAGIEQLFS